VNISPNPITNYKPCSNTKTS